MAEFGIHFALECFLNLAPKSSEGLEKLTSEVESNSGINGAART